MLTPYLPRPIRFLELWSVAEWRIKVYGIAFGRPQPRPELIAAAKQLVVDKLRELTADARHYQVGFLGIHDGRTSNFVFFDFWADENELHHRVFVSPTNEPERLADVTPTGLSACVWDLRVQAYERDAWVRHVLQCGEAPDFEGYLADGLNADV